MASILHAWALPSHADFSNALVLADSDHILGFTAIGPEAGAVILSHPTIAEGLDELFSGVPART